MGIYLNPGTDGFQQALNSTYVDKTGLIAFTNAVLDTNDKLTCVSRPRRFGKTMAAHMLCAYYDKSCNSRSMFENLEIANDSSFEHHLNQYDVIYLDITSFISRIKSSKKGLETVISDIQSCVICELKDAYPDCITNEITFLPDALAAIYRKTGDRFFFIIDEWDALFREAKEDVSVQKEYIQFLRGLFKSGPSSVKTIIGAYITGILPIKKYGTESALTDFREYTMIEPDSLTSYVGFTEAEVRMLCNHYHVDFEKMKLWYDGYSFADCQSIYSPNSVMQAISRKRFRNYWTRSESFESLKNYITMDIGGLKASIIRMLGGQHIRIDTLKFQNDLIHLDIQDQVLTLLIHLGYLAYDEDRREVFIPNLEVAEVFKSTVEECDWEEVSASLRQSDILLEKTLDGDSDYVACALREYHQQNTSVLKFNDENSLACVLTIAYYTARRDYIVIREFPSGKGFADLAFLPRRHTDRPAMIIELKYNKSAATALQQIKDRNYTGALREFTGNILLIGINYDKINGYSCTIEKYEK